jgi:hypothetical protein
MGRNPQSCNQPYRFEIRYALTTFEWSRTHEPIKSWRVNSGIQYLVLSKISISIQWRHCCDLLRRPTASNPLLVFVRGGSFDHVAITRRRTLILRWGYALNWSVHQKRALAKDAYNLRI